MASPHWPDRHDAAALWAELRQSTSRRFDDFSAADGAARGRAQRRLLLALELRWKLEEQVLLPALLAGQPDTRDKILGIEREIELLRDLSELVQGGGLSASSTVVVIGVLEGLAGLRSTQIERALTSAMQGRGLDGEALARDMEGLLGRWRGEVAESGDIEDEEMDPVGRPPR